jgi:hypothetical protein
MEMYLPNMAKGSQQTSQELKLGEAFIIESLVELSGEVSTSEQLIEFFDRNRIEGGLVNLMTMFSETRDGCSQRESAGVMVAVNQVEQELKADYSKASCLATIFTEGILLRLEITRRSPSSTLPSMVSI